MNSARLTTFAASLMSAATLHSAPLELFVSPTGDDSGSGARSAPFRTLERARDEIRAKKGLEDGAIVTVGGGIHERRKTFELGTQDSGTAEAPIVYRAEEGAEVRILGGTKIPSEKVTEAGAEALKRVIDPEARPHLRQIDLKSLGLEDYGRMQVRGFRRPYVSAPMELFIDGDAMHIARWPNEGSVPIGKVLSTGKIRRWNKGPEGGGKFTYDYDRPNLWKRTDDLWLSGYFAHGYADDTLKVAEIDRDKKTIQLEQSHLYGVMGGKKFRAYHALNLLEEIDRPGEYYIDREAGVVYFYPKGPMKNADICVSLMEEPMVTMEDASHVRIEGITFEVTRGMGVYIEGGTGNRIEGCTLRNMGIVAVCVGRGIAPDPEYRHNFTGEPMSRALGSWHEHIYDNPAFDRNGGTDHGIISCDIYNTGAGGISMGGGDRLTLTPAGNHVRNCDIHHFNRLDRTYKAGINLDGVGNRIEHSSIHDCPNSAIYVHGNDHLIEFNEVFNACLHVDDHGVFYLGRDPTERNNVLRHNFWHHSSIGEHAHSGAIGIYNDDGSCGTVVEGNVFYKVSKDGLMFYAGGSDHRFENNIVIDCGVPIRADNRLQNWAKKLIAPGEEFHSRMKLVKYDQPPYSERYPDLKAYWEAEPARPSGNTFKRNLLIAADPDRERKRLKSPWVEISDNHVMKRDPGFADAAKMDFTLGPDSVAFEKIPGFKPIPFGKIGLYKDRFRKQVK